MEKVKFGIICALKAEAEGLISRIENRDSRDICGIIYNFGMIGKSSVVVAVCGMGKVNAAICAQTMILTFNPDYIVNTGVAGALDNSLKTGDIVISDKLVQHDVDTSIIGDPVGYISGTDVIFMESDKNLASKIESAVKKFGYNYMVGTIASGDQFIATKESKDRIVRNFGAVACEMEGAAVAQVCYIAKVKFCILRSISDGADDNSNFDYVSFTKSSAEKSNRVLLSIL